MDDIRVTSLLTSSSIMTEEDICLQLVASDSSVGAGICLICTSEITEMPTTLDDEDDHRYADLKTVCESLQVQNVDRVIGKVKGDQLHSQVLFCDECHLRLDDLKELQDKVATLLDQIIQLKETFSDKFAEGTGHILRNGDVQVRSYIQAELCQDVKQETIVSDFPDPLSDHYDDYYPESPPAVKVIIHKGRRPRPRPRVSKSTLARTKPCEVRVTPCDLDDQKPSSCNIRRSGRRRKTVSKSIPDRKPRLNLKHNWNAVVETKIEPVDNLNSPPPLTSSPWKRRRLMQKIKTRTEEECPEGCGEKVAAVMMGYHMRQVHEECSTPYNCLGCEAEFETYSDLRKHIRTEHHHRLNGGDGNLCCSSCKKGFKNYDYLILHARRQGGVCRKSPLPMNSTLDPEKRELKCGVCEKTFKKRYLLEIHIKGNHSGVHPFLCEVCCKPFKREMSLKMHQRQFHPKEYIEAFSIDEEAFKEDLKNRKCDICNKTFCTEVAKKAHDVLHSRQFDYICNTCGIGCTTQRTLKQHEKVHSIKDLLCSQCPLKFTRIDKLRRHEKRIHPTPDERKQFECNACTKTFWDNYALQRHRRIVHRDEIPLETATEYQCTLCGYTCPDKGYLGIHFKSRRHKDKVAKIQFIEQEILVVSKAE